MKIKTQIILSAFFAMAISSLQALPAISSGNATDTDNKTNITNAKLQQTSGILVDNKALNDSKIKSALTIQGAVTLNMPLILIHGLMQFLHLAVVCLVLYNILLQL